VAKEIGIAVSVPEAARRAWGVRVRRLTRDPLSVVGLSAVLGLLAVAVVGPLMVRYDPVTISPALQLLPPSTAHWLGTDQLGRDVLARLVYGARLSLLVAIVVSALSGAVGLLIGGTSGYSGRLLDEGLMRVTDVFLSFPWLLLAMAVAMAAGPGLWNGMLALAFVWWPGYARLVRGQVLAIKSREFVDAAAVIGASSQRVLFRHVLPNCLGPYIVLLTIGAGRIILALASLSFLGLGAQPPTPEWGVMVAEGRNYFFEAWWVVTFPGLAILVAVVGFNLVGDALRDVLDPASPSG
jgi:peptide/nickel transport system permease protein